VISWAYFLSQMRKWGMDAVKKRKNKPLPESNPGRPARRYTDWAIYSSVNNTQTGKELCCVKE
jgi:hypothetical protein